ncbi:MAG TPA: DNA recombination protein RmuC [Cryomorphaceae bacterium]|nr:DNA recombination protein RmuC [Cryomorphaceae bacterium]
MVVLFAIGGFLIGALISWGLMLMRHNKSSKAAENQISSLQNDISYARQKTVDLEKELSNAKGEISAQHARELKLTDDLSRSRTEYENLNQRLKEQKQEIAQLNEKFATEFKNLANQIFEEKSKNFTDQNKENLGELLNPLRERILEFQKKVEDTNTQSVQRNAALNEQLKNLKELNQQITQEAKSLTLALRGDSKTQGGWGEMQLENILSKAGLQKDIHYIKEKNLKTEEGSNQRLDYIINLPDGKHLILDSKVSLTAYSRYYDSEDEAEQQRFLKQHLDSINGHIRSLGDRNYQSLYEINPPDYVMMFIANEPALTIALKEDPQLYEKALDRNIVLVSTTTLLATLRTISYIWKQDLQNKNAEEIARQAGALYDKFVSFSEDLMKLGNQLGTVQKTYTDSMKKLTDGTGNLVKRTEKLRELGAKTSKQADQRLLDRAD